MTIPGKKVATLEVPLRWGDMDAYGHANNTVYFRLFEEARIAWFNSLQLGGPEEPTGPVIIKTSATFLKELCHPATLLVETYVGKAGNTSLDTYYRLRDANSGEIYSEGDAKVVWFDRTARASAPLPDALRALAAG
ncbi:acyl-CoA thioesterase [Marinobacter salinisoli]|uniref:Acyl-CoA thioesterase n=1 Tax=Marinobacter salinisoli TaxID=2769486 RepID=A0ABX7MN84_9GAMM|nr:thioesterase family protein [Marinobacter salinisoli]QSP93720.1 acyl-CoA thioesterase [Marinobacter salinisoli]